MAKFCENRVYTYTGVNNVETTAHYVIDEDIINFHGTEFFNTWSGFASGSNITKHNFGTEEGYYYVDYVRFAYTTSLFLAAS